MTTQGDVPVIVELSAASSLRENAKIVDEQDSSSAITYGLHHDEANGLHHDEANGFHDDEDENVTVIFLDQADGQQQAEGTISLDWIEQQGPEMEQLRRTVLLRELKRAQRTYFWQFAMLCIIPVVLLLVVIVTTVGSVGQCVSTVTLCSLEPRTLGNAFTSRCVCGPVPVVSMAP
jgi:hypothetical protein